MGGSLKRGWGGIFWANGIIELDEEPSPPPQLIISNKENAI